MVMIMASSSKSVSEKQAIQGHGAALVAGVAKLPTEFGRFRVVSFHFAQGAVDHAALVWGNVSGKERVLTRVHSECLTGDVFASLRCDCRDQLLEAMKQITLKEEGVILYLRQEGRGIGLVNKVRAYGLQDYGLDTVEANRALGLPDDSRCYDDAAAMLNALDVRSIQLLTNNPDKVLQLEENGIAVDKRLAHQTPANRHNRNYLITKALRAGHLLDLSEVG
jgi:GTP cyclohydrolase II